MGTEEDWMIGRLEDWQRQRKRLGIEAWERQKIGRLETTNRN